MWVTTSPFVPNYSPVFEGDLFDNEKETIGNIKLISPWNGFCYQGYSMVSSFKGTVNLIESKANKSVMKWEVYLSWFYDPIS